MKNRRIKILIFFKPLYFLLEQKLNLFELSGYRVEKVYFRFIFVLRKKRNLNNATYYFTSYQLGDFDLGLDEVEEWLIRYYHAEYVPSVGAEIHLLRVCEEIEDEILLVEKERIKQKYFLHCLKIELIITIICQILANSLLFVAKDLLATYCFFAFSSAYLFLFSLEAVLLICYWLDI